MRLKTSQIDDECREENIITAEFKFGTEQPKKKILQMNEINNRTDLWLSTERLNSVTHWGYSSSYNIPVAECHWE